MNSASPAPGRDESKHERALAAELLPALGTGSFALCNPVKSHFPSCQVRRYLGAGGEGSWGFGGMEKTPQNCDIIASQPHPRLGLIHSVHKPACWIKETLKKRVDGFLP